ncbi:exopolyphosphatase PRUNE1 [Anopheles cruzii]|uniref:exopolyphosphatase PRUNE1 n=1 Tax=Anopheles cruzii TaxID=68878 RepID=UPI0022EC47EC|nr:exopolyphosphatase PRUNE1 [Anopheles cruzii]
MNKYLQQCKGLLQSATHKIAIIGNESCDLDSAVSALALAFHLHQRPTLVEPWHTKDTVMFPVLNVLRSELPLKTEVTYFLKQRGISLNNLTCSDEIKWEDETNTDLILVDHHLTKLGQPVIGIIDHRPVDAGVERINPQAFRTIDLVGSCATLVGREILKSATEKQLTEGYEDALELLYGAIVLDTVNFSKEADKAKPLDYEIAESIEAETHSTTPENRDSHRKSLFKSLVAARSDVSELNAYQLLLKDLKILSENNRVVTLPGFPTSVQEYLRLSGCKEHLSRFASTTKSNVVLLLGLKVLPDGSVRRDIGVVPIDDKRLAEKIVAALLGDKSTSFGLEKIETENVADGAIFFQQHNLKASRKQLIPIVKHVLSSL